MNNRDRAQVRLSGRFRFNMTMIHIDALRSLYVDKKPSTLKLINDLKYWGLVGYNTEKVLYRTVLGDAYLRYVAHLKEDEVITKMKTDIVEMEQKLNTMREQKRTKRHA